MPVLTDIEIELDAREVVLALHQGKRALEALVDETAIAIEQTRRLIYPRALYKWVSVRDVIGKQVVLADRSQIGPPCRSDGKG